MNRISGKCQTVVTKLHPTLESQNVRERVQCYRRKDGKSPDLRKEPNLQI